MSREIEPKPKVGPDYPTHPWPEYRQLREAVTDYLNHDADDPQYNDIWRALRDMLAEYQHDRLIGSWHLSEPAETAYARRLISGDGECTCDSSWVDRERETNGERNDPTHSDHATLWLDDDSNPAVYSTQVYHFGIYD